MKTRSTPARDGKFRLRGGAHRPRRPTPADVKRDLDQIVEALLPLSPARILLHGSMARGDWNRASDIDLIVVMETGARLVDRVRAILRLLDTEIPVEPMVYTPAEFHLGLAQGHPFLAKAIQEGRWIYQGG